MEVSDKKLKVKINKKCEHGKRIAYCQICGGSQLCEHGKDKSNCKECGTSLCEHNKHKSECRECKPSSICEHGKRKDRCRDCGGKGICEHKKLKSRCIQCEGSAICIHKTNKYRCIQCKGTDICEHNRRKQTCPLCEGSGICEHKKLKYNCIDCDGNGICIHKKEKTICKECSGSAICEHKNYKRTCKLCIGNGLCIHLKAKVICKDCHGSRICIHGISKYLCRPCKGNQICIHDKYKQRCKKCGGGALCKSSWCESRANYKFDKYCHFCYVHLYPDAEISKNYRTKEKTVADTIIKAFPNFTWIADKKIQDGCSLRRPDLLLDLGEQIIIVEVDENQHQSYDCSCENKRLMQISLDLDFRPIIFIRFNPDGFINKDNEKVKSCWKIGSNGCIAIQSKKQKEWDDKMDSLIESIKYWSINQSDKMIEVVQMYYDEITEEEDISEDE